jgi:phosphoglycerate dehydrogenase-like enzyme
MSEHPVHVVFGAGQVGRALTACLAGLDLPVRVLSRHRLVGLADVVDWRETDATR